MLARLAARQCNCLLLDEPINHLDIPSRTQFEQALAQFEGASGSGARPIFLEPFCRRNLVGRWRIYKNPICLLTFSKYVL